MTIMRVTQRKLIFSKNILKHSLLVMITTHFLLGCYKQQIICIPNEPIKNIKVSQKPATKSQPAKFYIREVF